ncbi:unnamed protein product [Prunus armeniaca]
MGSDNSTSDVVLTHNSNNSSSHSLITINVAAQLPLKLTPFNYPSWRAQFKALLLGYDLLAMWMALSPCPASNNTFWKSTWDKLTKLYANHTRSRVMSLKERLTLARRDSKPMMEFLQSIKALANELALIDSPISDDDLVIHILNGLGSDFKEIVVAIRARETPITFEELHDKLVDFESAIKCHDTPPEPLVVTANNTQRTTSNCSFHKGSSTSHGYKPPFQQRGILGPDNSFLHTSRPFSGQRRFFYQPGHNYKGFCQLCDQQGHSAKRCPHAQVLPSSDPTMNVATALHTATNWLIDSGASHHVTPNFANLSLHTNYEGLDSVVIGNGSSMGITHVGSTSLPTSSRAFALHDVLCPNKNDVYMWPGSMLDVSSPSTLVSTASTLHDWHSRLGHPSQPVLDQLIRSQSLPITSKSSVQSPYVSCQCNKSHKLPFHLNSLSSQRPLDLIYIDVWGPAPLLSIDVVVNTQNLNLFSPPMALLISPHLPTPPQHNGYAERHHRHIVETGLTLLHQAFMPLLYWSYAFQAAWLRPYTTHKLQPRSRPSLTTQPLKVLTSALTYPPIVFTFLVMLFLMNVYVWSIAADPGPIPDLPPALPAVPSAVIAMPLALTTVSPAPTAPVPAPVAPMPAQCTHHSSSVLGESSLVAPPFSHISSSSLLSSEASNPSLPSLPPPPPSSRVVTRSQNNIFKPKQLHTTTKQSLTQHPLPPTLEPTCVSHAIKDNKWRSAMSDEFTALVRNDTWELVPSRSNQNLVGCKWVFRIKRHPDGSINMYKARLVAKGFHQRPSIDFYETFSLVVKPTTIRVVLHLAFAHGWPIRQLDVNNVFLHGTLHEEAWYKELSSFLVSYGFHHSKSDASFFVYHHGSIVAYFLVYVDDLIVTGSDKLFITKFLDTLAQRFSLKDLGSLHFFLGVEVIPTRSGLFLSQHKYIRDLLIRAHMEGAKDVSTPLSTTTTLVLNDGATPTDATLFRSLISGLQYLSLTRPDIAFAVNKLSQFMYWPSELHWTALKCLLRYLKGTIYHGLHLHRNTTLSLSLHAFSDADWAGNPDDRTSTTAYTIFLGGNLISWSSRKQHFVARSSTEAEYRAVACTAAELSWLQNLLHELGVLLPSPPVIACDNIGATFLCANPVLHSHMKHIAIDLHFVRDLVTQDLFKVAHVSTIDQLADVLTKPLSRQHFHLLRSKIGVTDGGSILQRRIRKAIISPPLQPYSHQIK